MRTVVAQTILSLVGFVCPLAAAEFLPVAVWTDEECFSNLQDVREKTTRFIYAKHFIFGYMQGLAGKCDIPDEQVLDDTWGFKKGGQLCLGTLLADGTVKHEVLLEKPEGVICYPNLLGRQDAGLFQAHHQALLASLDHLRAIGEIDPHDGSLKRPTPGSNSCR